MFHWENKWNYIENFKISAFYKYGFIIEKVKVTWFMLSWNQARYNF